MIASEWTDNYEEVVNDYYEIYVYNLREGYLTVMDTLEILEELEAEEFYLECAGVFKAYNVYIAEETERYLNTENQ